MEWAFPNIDPVAFSLGPLSIRWYALAYLAGILIGWQYICYLTGVSKSEKSYDQPINKTDIDDFLPWAILGIIMGGRIGYCLFYQPEYYLANPLEMPKIWLGGMSFHGGALGVLVAMLAFSIKRKLHFLALTDLVSCAAPIGLFFGRLANFINGELYGRVTHLPVGMVFPSGGDFPRHPSQLYEAALEGLVLAVILGVLVRYDDIRKRHGMLTGVFLCGYAIFRSFVEFFREPDIQIGFLMDMFTMGQLLCVPMFIGGLVLIFYSFKKSKAGDNAVPKEAS